MREQERYEGIFDDSVTCRGCPWTGKRVELINGEEAEIMHPRNKEGIVHRTKYEKCPRCGRWLIADGQPALKDNR